MAREIHPTLTENTVKCSGCGNIFQVFTTMNHDAFDIETCNQCHPAYTGKRRASTTGQVEKFNKKYAGFAGLMSAKPASKSDSE